MRSEKLKVLMAAIMDISPGTELYKGSSVFGKRSITGTHSHYEDTAYLLVLVRNVNQIHRYP